MVRRNNFPDAIRACVFMCSFVVFIGAARKGRSPYFGLRSAAGAVELRHVAAKARKSHGHTGNRQFMTDMEHQRPDGFNLATEHEGKNFMRVLASAGAFISLSS
jgi:hypothetical protein